METQHFLPYNDAHTLSCSLSLSLSHFKKVLAAERVALFVPLPGREVDVFPAVSALRALGKRVLLPRIDGEVLRFVLHEDSEQEEEQEEEGKHSRLQAHPRLGFLQPPAHAAEEEPDVVVCPGRAFDRAGHRIGFGKGYYDQGLARLQRPPAALIGVCFACQLFDSVPHEEHDRNMTRVLAWQEQ